jgi:YVTN family beta-propeller protein
MPMIFRLQPARATVLGAVLVAVLVPACGETAGTDDHPIPTATALSPTSITAGTSEVDLVVTGSGFVPASRVQLDGIDHATLFVADTRLRAPLVASELLQPRTAEITVFNPAPGGGTSAALSFTIEAALPPGTTLELLALGGTPHGVAVAPDGTICVSQITSNSITCGTVTPTGQAWARTIPVGNVPAHVALNPAGTRAYTANQESSSVSVVDVAAGTVTATIPLSDGGFNLLVSPDGSRLYVTTASGTLHVIDTGTNQVVTTFAVGPAANGLAFDSTAGVLYVSARDANTVTAIDAAADTVTRVYSVSGMPQRLALAPAGGTLYVANEVAGLDELDLVSGSRLSLAAVPPRAVGVAITPDGARLFVTNPPGGLLYAVDAASRSRLYQVAMGRPRNVAFTRDGTTAIVTDEAGSVAFIR